MVRPRTISLAERRALLARRADLAALGQHPSWDVLGAVVEEEIEKVKTAILGAAMGDAGVSLEQQAYWRGKIAGLRQARKIPTTALSKEQAEEAASV